MIQVGMRYGMQTMDDSIRKLVESGVVDPSEAGEMMKTLSGDDIGSPAPAAGGAAKPAPTAAAPTAPQPAPAAAPEQKKSRSLF